jgi:hypothetical protein
VPFKTQLVQTITDGIDCPQTLAVDSAGRLYVANNANGTATLYAAKTRKLLRTISKKVRDPWGPCGGFCRHPFLGELPANRQDRHLSAGSPAAGGHDRDLRLTLAIGPP